MIFFNMYMAAATQTKNLSLSNPRDVASLRTAAITSCGVTMAYQNGQQSYQVLKNIDLTVQKGDVQLLMGPSGSGKTTLLSILAGLLTPTSGRVCLLGQEITK
ncbi:ABC transporter ATP-binding protein, partial [Hydrocoleum sp. CS-953]